MFSFRNKAAQAKRELTTANTPEFKWHRSYNWLLLLVPFIGGGVYLSTLDTILPIKTIQLSGSFKYINQQEVKFFLTMFL